MYYSNTVSSTVRTDIQLSKIRTVIAVLTDKVTELGPTQYPIKPFLNAASAVKVDTFLIDVHTFVNSPIYATTIKASAR